MNIGIIGGADGPTSIFLSSSMTGNAAFGLITVIVTTVVIVRVIKKIRKKHSV